MKFSNMHIEPVSETSMILCLGDAIDIALTPLMGRITQRVLSECSHVRELTPSYTTILIEVDASVCDMEKFRQRVLSIAKDESERVEMYDSKKMGNFAGHMEKENIETGSKGKLIELPVYYNQEVGADLGAVAEYAGLTIDETVAIHSERDYWVCAIGFAPGFAFLADVDERIAMPRRDRPAARIAAGSVGIAEQQTAVYPCDTPGGWQIIGNCPVPLFDPTGDPSSPFEVGDRVRFRPVDREEFLKLGGDVQQ